MQLIIREVEKSANVGTVRREAEMFASWAEEHSASGLLHVRKLWMFDNKLGDSGAVALAGLFRRGLLEVQHGPLYVIGVMPQQMRHCVGHLVLCCSV
jgi:hypothetical protein